MRLLLRFDPHRVLAAALVAVTVGVGPIASVEAAETTDGAVTSRMEALLEPLALDRSLETGILLDRVLSLGGPEVFDASEEAPEATFGDVVQIQSELRRAATGGLDWAGTEQLRARAERWAQQGAVALVFVEARYETLQDDVLETGALRAQGRQLTYGTDQLNEVFASRQTFSFAPARVRTFVGESVTFVIDPALIFRGGSAGRAMSSGRLDVDFDDGGGFLPLPGAFGGEADPLRVQASYEEAGSKTLRARLSLSDGRVLEARAAFEVARLGTPSPDQTLSVTASIPYLGQPGTGQAYVYLAPGHTVLTRPVVVIEGFDIDNSLDWPGLYAILNTENLLEDLRALGYDAVVLNFSDATDYLQRNGLLVVELLQQVQSMVPGEDIVLVGASMGGLLSRYALAYMETNAIAHQVPLWISFDAPQAGANIPLGIQYWVNFFASESTEAEALLASLNSPAARQLLSYHFTEPPTVTGTPDPLRTAWLADLAAAGDYPSLPRRVSIANGSGSQMDQGFNAAAQVVEWEYSSLLVDVTGNVWALPDGNSAQIFEGLIDIFILGGDSQNVTVTGTDPHDSAPGGFRDSMAQMDEVTAPYGDIVALHDTHCFIPTVSALDVDGADLFEDLAGDPDLVTRTPFHAVYFPVANQDHVLVTPENKVWVLDEIQNVASSVPEAPVASETSSVARILAVAPHPLTAESEVRFSVVPGERFTLSLIDPVGRRMTTLRTGMGQASQGAQSEDESKFDTFSWSRTLDGRLPSGVYFLVLEGEGSSDVQKVVVR